MGIIIIRLPVEDFEHQDKKTILNIECRTVYFHGNFNAR